MYVVLKIRFEGGGAVSLQIGRAGRDRRLLMRNPARVI
jgi:hypothetical protein